MYDIRYFDDDRGNEIELPSKIMRFKTESQRVLPSNILIDSYKSFKDNMQQAIEDYETFFNTDEYEDRTNEKFSIKIQKFTKLVYLYLDYCEDDCFMYPFILVKDPTTTNDILYEQNVKITQKDGVVTASRAEYLVKSNNIFVSGNVIADFVEIGASEQRRVGFAG